MSHCVPLCPRRRPAGPAPEVPDAEYTAAMVDFLAAGGDGYTVFANGTERVDGPSDLDALVAYLHSLPEPADVKTRARITVLA